MCPKLTTDNGSNLAIANTENLPKDCQSVNLCRKKRSNLNHIFRGELGSSVPFPNGCLPLVIAIFHVFLVGSLTHVRWIDTAGVQAEMSDFFAPRESAIQDRPNKPVGEEILLRHRIFDPSIATKNGSFPDPAFRCFPDILPKQILMGDPESSVDFFRSYTEIVSRICGSKPEKTVLRSPVFSGLFI